VTEENLEPDSCLFFETGVSSHHWVFRVFRHLFDLLGFRNGPAATLEEQAAEPAQKTLEGVADFCNNAGHAGKRLNPGE